MVSVRGGSDGSVHPSWPVHFLAVPRFRVSWRCAVSGSLGVAHVPPAVLRFLEQALSHSRCHCFHGSICFDAHDHSIHSRRLGCLCGRLSGNGRSRAVSHEGHRPSCRIDLFAEGRCIKGLRIILLSRSCALSRELELIRRVGMRNARVPQPFRNRMVAAFHRAAAVDRSSTS